MEPHNIVILPCLHKFDSTALKQAWTLQDKRKYCCPLCRTAVSPADVGIKLDRVRRNWTDKNDDSSSAEEDTEMAPNDDVFELPEIMDEDSETDLDVDDVEITEETQCSNDAADNHSIGDMDDFIVYDDEDDMTVDGDYCPPEQES